LYKNTHEWLGFCHHAQCNNSRFKWMDKVHARIALNQVQNHIDNCQYRCTNISSCNAFNWKLEIYNVIESWFNQCLTWYIIVKRWIECRWYSNSNTNFILWKTHNHLQAFILFHQNILTYVVITHEYEWITFWIHVILA
jgi:hypothetical protein